MTTDNNMSDPEPDTTQKYSERVARRLIGQTDKGWIGATFPALVGGAVIFTISGIGFLDRGDMAAANLRNNDAAIFDLTAEDFKSTYTIRPDDSPEEMIALSRGSEGQSLCTFFMNSTNTETQDSERVLMLRSVNNTAAASFQLKASTGEDISTLTQSELNELFTEKCTLSLAESYADAAKDNIHYAALYLGGLWTMLALANASEPFPKDRFPNQQSRAHNLQRRKKESIPQPPAKK